MSRSSAREQLVDFLQRHAFQPVLRAKDNSVPRGKQEELHDLQDRTKTEIERFRNYGTAEDVVTNFRRDLHSNKAREVQGRLKTLDTDAARCAGGLRGVGAEAGDQRG
jgi:hypothetical protein